MFETPMRPLRTVDGRLRGEPGTCPNCGVLTRRYDPEDAGLFRTGAVRVDVGFGWCRNCKEATECDLDDFLADYDPLPKVRAISATAEEPGAQFNATPMPAFFAEGACASDAPGDWTDAAAKMACRLCPFWFDCLEWALDNPEVTAAGVYGGMGPAERRSYLERRRKVMVGDLDHEERGADLGEIADEQPVRLAG